MAQPPIGWTVDDIEQFIELLQHVYYTFTGTDGSVAEVYQDSTQFLKDFGSTLKQLKAYTEQCGKEQYSKRIGAEVKTIDEPVKQFQSFASPLEKAYHKLPEKDRSSGHLISNLKKARANAYMSLSSLSDETKKLEELIKEQRKKISKQIEKETSENGTKFTAVVARFEFNTEILRAVAEDVRNRAETSLVSIETVSNNNQGLNFGSKVETEKLLQQLETVAGDLKKYRQEIDKTPSEGGISLEKYSAQLEEQRKLVEDLESSLKGVYRHARRSKSQKQVAGWASSLLSAAGISRKSKDSNRSRSQSVATASSLAPKPTADQEIEQGVSKSASH